MVEPDLDAMTPSSEANISRDSHAKHYLLY